MKIIVSNGFLKNRIFNQLITKNNKLKDLVVDRNRASVIHKFPKNTTRLLDLACSVRFTDSGPKNRAVGSSKSCYLLKIACKVFLSILTYIGISFAVFGIRAFCGNSSCNTTWYRFYKILKIFVNLSQLFPPYPNFV